MKKILAVFFLFVNILMLAFVAIGSTLSMFTKDFKEEVYFTVGTIDLTANITSVETNANVNKIENDTLSISNMTLDDSVSFKINFENDSNIKVRYRVKLVFTDELEGNVTSNDYLLTDWEVLDIKDEVREMDYTIELNQNLNPSNSYSGNIKVLVEAVQYNAFNKVTFVNNDGTVIKETVAPYGWSASYVGENPIYEEFASTYANLAYHYEFDEWDNDLNTPVTSDKEFKACYKEVIDMRLRFTLEDDISLYSSRNSSYYSVTIDQSFEKERYISSGDYDIEIPSIFNGLPVKVYNASDLTVDSYIKDVKLPDSMEYISSDAFNSWDTLTSINLANVKGIGTDAFKGCVNINEIFYNESFEQWFKVEFDNKYSTPASYGANLYFYDENDDLYKEINSLTTPSDISSISWQLYGIKNIKNLVITNNVTTIYEGALNGLSSLESLTIPFIGSGNGSVASKETLFGYIFGSENYENSKETIQYYSSSDSVIYYLPTSLTKVVVGGNFDTIYYGAFSNCSLLTDVSVGGVGDQIRYIQEKVFFGCSNIVNMAVPFISSDFNFTTSNATTTYGYFFGTDKFDNTTLCWQIYEWTQANGSQGLKYYIPNGLKNVTIYNGVILYGAFDKMTWLEKVKLDDGVTRVANYTFNGAKLNTLEVGSGIISLDSNAFKSNIKEIYLSPIAKMDAIYATWTTPDLKNVYFKGQEQEWLNMTFPRNDNNPMYVAQKLYFLNSYGDWYEVTDFVVPDGTTTIGTYALYGLDIEEVIIPDTVTKINAQAFNMTESLQTVYYKGTLNSWSKIAFNVETSNPLKYAEHLFVYEDDEWIEATALDSIYVTEATVLSLAYYGLDNIKNVYITNKTTKINTNAFSGCTGIENVYYDGEVYEWAKLQLGNEIANPMYYGKHFYTKGEEDYDLVTKLNLTGTQYVTTYAFYGFEDITSVYIANKTTKVQSYAFYGCTNLRTVDFPDTVFEIGTYAFDECPNLEFNYYGNGYYLGSETNPYALLMKLDDVEALTFEFNENTKLIYPYAFKDCTNIEVINIPLSMTIISSYAFSDNQSIKYIYLHDNVTTIYNYAFRNCTNLKEMTLNVGTKPGNGLFYGCTSLEKVTILSASTITLTASMFYNCISLKEVYIPETVITIHGSVFNNCTSLTELIIPISVKTIAYGGLKDITNLEYIYYEGTKDDWSKISISGGNTQLDKTPICYYSEDKPTDTNNIYWHYVDNIPTIWE